VGLEDEDDVLELRPEAVNVGELVDVRVSFTLDVGVLEAVSDFDTLGEPVVVRV
jgi:hypothetical protein